jgi:hypothetical protein
LVHGPFSQTKKITEVLAHGLDQEIQFYPFQPPIVEDDSGSGGMNGEEEEEEEVGVEEDSTSGGGPADLSAGENENHEPCVELISNSPAPGSVHHDPSGLKNHPRGILGKSAAFVKGKVETDVAKSPQGILHK